VIDFGGALLLFAYAFRLLHRWPQASDVALALVFLVVAILILYSIWILVVCAAFWVVKVDNLSYLFGSVFDAARWPINVFRGTLRFVFTFVFPLAVMTTYPALALLGKLTAPTAILAIAGGVGFAIVARMVWLRSLGLYTSASS
jgi:ABC-2 type transport system permease protein